MTAALLTTLRCNRRIPGMTIARECGAIFDHRGTPAQARAAAAATGWTATALADFCPAHTLPREDRP